MPRIERWDNLPANVRQHLVDRLRDRAISLADLNQNSVISSEARNLSFPLHPLAFSGIHILSPRLLPMLTEQGVFSIIPSYLRLAAQDEKILAFPADQYYWRDLGRPADLIQAALDLETGLRAKG